MRARHRSARAVAATVVLGGCLVASAGASPPAVAGSSIEQGWWWKGDPGTKAPVPDGAPAVELPAQPPAAPTPPNVSGDDLMVAASVDGDLAIAAVRTQLPDGQGMPALKLDVADNGDINGSGAHLLACAANDGWVGADAGRWDMRPTPNCEQSVAGVPASDGKSVTFPIQPLSASGVVNVAIVPAKDANGVTTPFQLVFKKATDASLTTQAAGSETLTGAGGDASAGNFDSGDSSAALDAGFAGSSGTSDLGSSASFSGGSAGGSASTPTGAGTSPGGTSSSGGAAQRPQAQLQASAPVRTQPASTSTDARTLGLAVLLAGAAAAWFTTRQKLPTPHSLSRVASRRPTATERVEPTPGGLGRFARPRTGPPPKLF